MTLHVFQFLNDSLERLDHCVPLHRAGCVQNLEVVGHSVFAVLMLFNELLHLRQLRLQGFVLLAQYIVGRPGSVGRLDSAHPVGQLADGRLMCLGVLVARQEVGHVLQLRQTHRFDGVLQFSRTAAIVLHLLG